MSRYKKKIILQNLFSALFITSFAKPFYRRSRHQRKMSLPTITSEICTVIFSGKFGKILCAPPTRNPGSVLEILWNSFIIFWCRKMGGLRGPQMSLIVVFASTPTKGKNEFVFSADIWHWPKIFLISCSFWEIKKKLYVGTPSYENSGSAPVWYIEQDFSVIGLTYFFIHDKILTSVTR